MPSRHSIHLQKFDFLLGELVGDMQSGAAEAVDLHPITQGAYHLFEVWNTLPSNLPISGRDSNDPGHYQLFCIGQAVPNGVPG